VPRTPFFADVQQPTYPVSVTRQDEVRGIDGGLDHVAADRERQSAVYSGLQATLYARLATQSCSSRRLQRAAEMGGKRPFAYWRTNGK
jgi:hypothetical protein